MGYLQLLKFEVIGEIKCIRIEKRKLWSKILLAEEFLGVVPTNYATYTECNLDASEIGPH